MMSEYPKNVSINQDSKSKFWFVSFLTKQGRKRRSTKIPVDGGLYRGEKLTKSQARNRALIEGQRMAEEECKEIDSRYNISVADFLNGFLERREPYIAHATYVNMKATYKNFCSYLGIKADRPISLIKRSDTKGFVEFRRREVRAKTVKKDLAGLSAAFNDALDSEIIMRNPFSRLKIDPDSADEKLSHEAFTIEEIRFMVQNFPPEWSSAVRCCVETYGQRLGDILALRWVQFDFEKRVVFIDTGKTGKELVQPMRGKFYTWALNEYKNRNAKPDDFVHPLLAADGPGRASIEFGQLLRAFKIGVVSSPAGGKRRNINSKTFHCIRATCATLLQASGVSSDMAMKLVGHDSEAIHRGYVRPDEEQLREMANVLPELGV